MTRIKRLSTCFAFVVLATSAGCESRLPEEDPARELRESIAPELGLAFQGDLKQGEEKNFVGVRSEHLLLSRRNDSRTYFIQDERWGVARSGGVFDGPDDELIERSKEVAVRLEIDPAEISKASVIQVMSNSASVDPVTGEVKTEIPGMGERYGQLTRSVQGVPVFSSRVLMALDKKGQIGFLELHWPIISDTVIAEALKLQEQTHRGWKPPQLAEAQVESIEAGILHSPAIGFVMDIKPVIRVVYRPSSPDVGKKAVLYLDAQGRSVPIPRQFEKLELPEEKQRKRGHGGKEDAS